jgi:hypothetical protein
VVRGLTRGAQLLRGRAAEEDKTAAVGLDVSVGKDSPGKVFKSARMQLTSGQLAMAANALKTVSIHLRDGQFIIKDARPEN